MGVTSHLIFAVVVHFWLLAHAGQFAFNVFERPTPPSLVNVAPPPPIYAGGFNAAQEALAIQQAEKNAGIVHGMEAAATGRSNEGCLK